MCSTIMTVLFEPLNLYVFIVKFSKSLDSFPFRRDLSCIADNSGNILMSDIRGASVWAICVICPRCQRVHDGGLSFMLFDLGKPLGSTVAPCRGDSWNSVSVSRGGELIQKDYYSHE